MKSCKNYKKQDQKSIALTKYRSVGCTLLLKFPFGVAHIE